MCWVCWVCWLCWVCWVCLVCGGRGFIAHRRAAEAHGGREDHTSATRPYSHFLVFFLADPCVARVAVSLGCFLVSGGDEAHGLEAGGAQRGRVVDFVVGL